MKTKIPHPFVISWKPLNPDYPSVPLGMRVSDLPPGWSSAGHPDVGMADSTPHRYGLAKLTPGDASAVRDRYLSGETGRHIAATYGVHPSQISRILSGKAWSRA